MAVYKLSMGVAVRSELLPEVVSNRTLVTGDYDTRSRFAAYVAADVSKAKGGNFLGRKVTTSGKVLLFLPTRGTHQTYANLIKQAGGDAEGIDWTADIEDLITIDLSEYALVVVDELSHTCRAARSISEMTEDVRLPNALFQARNLIMVSDISQPRNGHLTQSSLGEVALLQEALTEVATDQDVLLVTDRKTGKELKLNTDGSLWTPPKAPEQTRGDWVQQYYG